MLEPLRLPGYLVERLAGSGGAGDVWVAVEQATGRRVALKRLRGAGPAERDLLLREGALQASLSHPHVLAARGVVETPNELVLVLDLAEGGSLRDLLHRRGRLPAGEVVTTVAPIGQALVAIHRVGLVHGDLTPGNILYTRSGRPLLADLGIAAVVGVPPTSGAATAAFGAPEVLGGGRVSPASDVYGLAAVTVAALTGVPPGSAASAELPDLPTAPVELLRSALSGRPGRRPDAAALAGALFDLAPPAPVRLATVDAPGVEGTAMSAGEAAAPYVEDDAAGGVPDVAWSGPPPSPPAARSPSPPGPLGRASARHARRIRARQRRPSDFKRPPAGGPAGDSQRAPVEPVAGDDQQTHRVRAAAPVPTEPAPPTAARRVPLAWVAAGVGLIVLLGWGIGMLLPRPLLGRGATPPALAAGVASVVSSPTPLATPSPTASGRAVPPLPAATRPPCAAARASPMAAAAPDWVQVIERVYAARNAAFRRADPGLLCHVYAAGSPGLRRDESLLELYRRSGVRAQGLRVDVLDAVAESRSGSADVVLRITDRADAYEVVDRTGTVRQRQPALPTRSWRAAMVHVEDGWRIR